MRKKKGNIPAAANNVENLTAKKKCLSINIVIYYHYTKKDYYFKDCVKLVNTLQSWQSSS